MRPLRCRVVMGGLAVDVSRPNRPQKQGLDTNRIRSPSVHANRDRQSWTLRGTQGTCETPVEFATFSV
jgi:hypothetical protein